MVEDNLRGGRPITGWAIILMWIHGYNASLNHRLIEPWTKALPS